VPLVHEFVGYVVVALFAVGWVWGLGAWLSKRGPGDPFWRWLTVVQVVSVAQVLIGVTLFAVGRRQGWLHYAYGVFPLFALAVAHGMARQEPYRPRPWVPFAWASFFSFGLTLRALMTGLGIG